MRSYYLIALAFALPTIACAANHNFDTLEKKASYSIGVDFINRMQAQNAPLDVDSLILGLKDASSGNKTSLSNQEMAQARLDFQKLVTNMRDKKQKELATQNIESGKTFLTANASKEGVVTTESGLQYKVIKKGNGAAPKLDDTVVTHYEGRLITGEVFDSSYKRNQPATFPVKGVIKGWTEALQLMQVGAKWQLFIPSDIAYGASQKGPFIKPYSTLVFDIELLEIKPAK